MLVRDGRAQTAKPTKCCFLWICALSPLTTTSRDISPRPFEVCHRHREVQAGADPRAVRGWAVWAVPPLDAASGEGDWAERHHDGRRAPQNICNHLGMCELVENCLGQTPQLSEEPHFLKLPSTAVSRSDQTEALEVSQWCQTCFYLCLTCKQLLVPAEE